MPASRISRVLVVATVLAAAACGRVISPPPPVAPPDVTHEVVVVGAPVSIAARGARTLYQFGYNTKRFGRDSTWGFRAVDSVNVRLRYTRPSDDSTRVLIEMWGRCRQRGCLRNDLLSLVGALEAEEGPPM